MDEKLSLTELQRIIRDALYLSLPEYYWVIAEISELKENYSGHCYMELIEKQPDEKDVRARVKAIIWNNRYRFLKSLFRDATGESISEGMKILARVKVEYHEIYGLSLLIHDIDPSYTIGEMAMKKQMVIRRLTEEGVLTMNRELEFPLLPQKIAVISSESAAGYRDFISHINGNSSSFIFYTALFESAMQGKETEQSIIAALDRIAGYQDLFDVAVIIRGGGSQTDLSWFDSYSIAYHVTQFPLPVITGIGHDKDLSVTDMVAFQALKTPTAVADFLIEKAAGAEAGLNEMSTAITDFTRTAIDDNRNMLESLKHKMASSVRMITSGKNYHIERLRKELSGMASNALERIKTRIEGMKGNLEILDPVNVLKRGYSITTLNGKILRSADETAAGDRLKTTLADGEIESEVKRK